MAVDTFRAVALFDYGAENDAELTLSANETYIITETNDSGWWHGNSDDGESGWAPSNYLKKLEDEEDDEPPDPDEGAPVESAAPPTAAPSKPPEDVKAALDKLKDSQTKKICKGCNQEVIDSFVMAKKNHFHVDCFKCTSCQQTLAGKGYVERDDEFFCENCYHQKYSPKCAHCRDVIKGQYITALNQTWHADHFVCTDCSTPFTSDQFRKRGDMPYCEDCYAKNFTVNCAKCGEAVQGKVFSANEKSFHEDCFICCSDGKPIGEEKPFHVRGDDIYCVEHYRENFIHTCTNCNKDIEGKYINVLDKFYHEECWTCTSCSKSLADGDFQMLNDGFVCPDCAPAGRTGESQLIDETNEHKHDPAPSTMTREPPPQDLGRRPNAPPSPYATVSNPNPAPSPPASSPPPPASSPQPPRSSPPASSPPSQPVSKSEPPSQVSVGEDNSRMESQKEQQEVGTSFSLAQLQDKENLPPGVDKGNRELSLSEKDFKELFKMDKHDYTSLAIWKKKQLKRKAGLF